MQSLGFAYAVGPVLKKLYPDQQEYEARLKVHRDYFNTQPYLAAFILGAVVRLEEERASGRDAAADVQGLKLSLAAPLGALGDSFFWGSLKPFASVIAAALLLGGSWWSPVVFLVIYNSWHLALRAGGLFWGYRSKGDAVGLMKRYRFTSRAKQFKVITLALLGGMVGAISIWRTEFRPLGMTDVLAALSGLVLMLVMLAVLRMAGSPVKLMLGLAAICIALAYIGVI